MRGFDTKSLRDKIIKGLRRFKEDEESEAGLVECYNLVPRDKGLAEHDLVISLNASGETWGGTGLGPSVDYSLDNLEAWFTDDIELSIMR